MKEEKLKQLKMALTEHKDLILKLDNDVFKLSWNTDMQKYQGTLGIWTIGVLLDIANGKINGTSLEVSK